MKKLFLAALLSLSFLMPVMADSNISLNEAEKIWTAWVEYDGTDVEVFAAFYQDGMWSDAVAATNNTYNEIAPAVALDSRGIPYIVYSGGDGVSSSIYIVTIGADGKWGEPAMISDFNAEEDTTPAIMIDKSDNIWVSWASYSGVSDDIVYNVRRGGSWEGTKMISQKNTTPDISPEIVSLADGSVCVVWSSYTGDAYKLFSSVFDGSTWSNPSNVTGDAASVSEIIPSALTAMGETLIFWSEDDIVKSQILSNMDGAKDKKVKATFAGANDILKGLTPNQIAHSSIAWLNKDNISQSVKIKYLEPDQVKSSMLAGFFKTLAVGNVIFATVFDALDFSIREAYAAVDTNKYLAYGDSITYGTFSSGNNGVGGYPAKLSSMLGKSVVNKGIPGERTASGLSRLSGVLSSVNPGCMLLMEGTNDVGDGTSSGTIKHNLGVMIDKATAYGTKTILATIIPRKDVFNDRAIDLNNNIRALAGEKGVYLVDMYTIFEGLDQNTYYTDHLHPTDAGYQVMADNWNAAISASGSGANTGSSDGGGGGGGGGCGTIRPTKGQLNGNISLLLFVLGIFGFYRFRIKQVN